MKKYCTHIEVGCYSRPSAHVPTRAATVDTPSPQLEKTPLATVVAGAPEFIFGGMSRSDRQDDVAAKSRLQLLRAFASAAIEQSEQAEARDAACHPTPLPDRA